MLLAPTLLGRRRALAAPPRVGEVCPGEPVAKAGPGALPILQRGGFVRLGKPLLPQPRAPRGVFSVANANDRYAAVAPLAQVPKVAPYLVLPGGALGAESWGTGFGNAGGGAVTFYLDRATADVLAAAWQTTRQDRQPLGQGLVGRWRMKTQPLSAGQPMEIVLTVENTGQTPVGFAIGGRQRGPRDNRFDFVVEAAGKALPVIDAPDFGGIGYHKVLKPGDQHELSADLASWTRIDAAGTYRVRCRYQADLVPDDQSAQWPERGHKTWDFELTGDLDITVR